MAFTSGCNHHSGPAWPRGQQYVSLADGAMACERPAGWCAKKSIRYSLEDCNLDGIKDQVCDNSLASATDKRKSIRFSGECNTYDNCCSEHRATADLK